MRAFEILQEQSVEQDAQDALITLLTSMHAMGIAKVKVSQVIKSLEDQNFFMDISWVRENMQDMDIVDAESSDEENIMLNDVSGRSAAPQAGKPEQEQDSEQQVDRMAKHALNKRIS
jgi:hypothetical protein